MMSRKSTRELVEALRPRYLGAKRAEEQVMLDELVATTSYHRKYAIRVQRHVPRAGARWKRPGRRAIQRGAVVVALEQIWEIYGRIRSKRLHPHLPEAIKVLEWCGELELTQEVRQRLLAISPATIDRCLLPVRVTARHGLRMTKPGTLIKKGIPVRTFADWNEDQPGFLEIDLVAHCGETGEGQFLNTLTCTDICTGWTVPMALPRRTQQAVCDAIQRLRQRLLFALLGIDFDNGGEFINDLLYRYCLDQKMSFTRSRPYKKNDQAHVEQKNWSVVRHTVGYDRFETDQQLATLEGIHDDLQLYVNFLQPVLKLMDKERIGNRLLRKYDRAKTPYQRLLERTDVPLAKKALLTHLYLQLNPASLRRRLDDQIAKLWKTAREHSILMQRSLQRYLLL